MRGEVGGWVVWGSEWVGEGGGGVEGWRGEKVEGGEMRE